MSRFLLMFTWLEYVYAYFVYIRMMSLGPRCQRQEPFFWLEFFWKLGYDMNRWGLMDFLVFMVPKLCSKCCKLIREISSNPLGASRNIWNLLAVSLAPEMLESRSRALKTCIITTNLWCFQPQNQLVGSTDNKKICKIYPNLNVNNQKSQTQNLSFFLELKKNEYFEGLNSSLAQSAGKLWPLGKNDQSYLLWNFNVCPIFGFEP